MTYLAKTMILSALLAVPTFAQADTYSGTFTGPNGGTAVYNGECTAAEGQVNCTRSSILTGPEGKTATRDIERTWTREKATSKVVATGEGGRTVTRTRERLR
jgi:hypothetical protein